jgi:hypothetical protein
MKNNIPINIFFLLVMTGIYSCMSESQNKAKSFCYWDTTYKLDTALYHEYGIKHLYIRYFDVDWDESSHSARPIATLSADDSIPDTFTPVVYITNTVFEKSNQADLDSLASRISRRIQSVDLDFENAIRNASNIHWDDSIAFKKIQARFVQKYANVLIDCDWTEGTNEAFFRFIHLVKKAIPDKEIHVTLRLWQYKYRSKAGIPPVDRCLLMCYNMQMANDYSVTNSIATQEELRKYIQGEKYPLKLDVALPVFSWAVLFRNQKSIGIIGNVGSQDFRNDIENYKSVSDNRYTLLNDRVIGKIFARRGDEVRVEAVNPSNLVEMARYLNKQLGTDAARKVTFFAWNRSYLKNYNAHELDQVVSAFTR